MMGQQPAPQEKLFYTGITLDKRVRRNHPLRKIDEVIDFEFIYNEVKDKYGSNGNVSVPPPVILKLMLLLVFYNVRSERELMETLPERLEWLWFLGYDLDTDIPNHSILSKARKKWGVETFKRFFERIVWQCVEAGLVDGSKIFIDSSLIDADASNKSVVDTQSLKRYLNKSYQELEKRLDIEDDSRKETKNYRKMNNRYISTTDPDAAIVRVGRPKLRYHTHRAVDPAAEVITATEVTTGDVNEAHRMDSLMETHQENTGSKVETVVGDSKYGTIENYLSCHAKGVKAHMPDLKRKQAKSGLRNGVFGSDTFIYDKKTDTYTCPGGKRLKRKKHHKVRQSIDYGALKSECNKCELRPQCTKNKAGRTVKRHLQQEALDQMRASSETAQSKRDIKTRHHLMERSFARAKRYGYKRSRWRRLWRVQIQEYITAAIQNMEILIRYGKGSGVAIAMALGHAKRKVYLLPILFLKYSNDLIFGEDNILLQHGSAIN
jgi:transposase